MHHLVHLICGSTGAGKTTYARQLAERIGAVRFSIDEWMTTLFWMDTPNPLQAAWSMERVERCYSQIWTVAPQVAAQRVPCVLDLGFTQANSRARFVALAGEAGFSVQLHLLHLPVEERWRRVQARNGKRDDAYQLPFDVTREMFDFVETLWEPPTQEEMATCDGIQVSSDSGRD
jgi:predicted kinase